MGTCLVCDRDAKLTNEHIIPWWASGLIREISPNEPARGSGAGVEAVGQRLGTIPRWNPSDIDLTVKGLCHECNSGLDDQAREVLEGLIRGDIAVLDSDRQVAVAAWAFGKALVMDLLDAGTDLEELSWAMHMFRRDKRPAQQAQIWLASFDPATTWPESAARVMAGELAVGPPVASWSTLVIGRWLTTVVRWRHEARSRFEMPDQVIASELRQQVWPVARPLLHWPMPTPMTYDDIINLETWGGTAAPATRRSLVGMTPKRKKRRK